MNCLYRSACLVTIVSALGSAAAWGGCPTEQAPSSVMVKGALSLDEALCVESQISLSNLLQGGDAAIYWTRNIARHMLTAAIPRRLPTRMLEKAPVPAVASIEAESALGRLSLSDFLADPRSGARGFVVINKGEIVYEQYPGMRDSDSHLWASNAKPMASLLVDLLIDQGKLDERRVIGDYLPDFRGTAWESIKVIDVLDMAPGLDTEENSETRSDPNSIAIRTFLAEMGEPRTGTGKLETVRDILKDAKKVREPGTQFEYGSPVTQALVLLTEEVAGKRWADLFDEMVWSKMFVEGDLQVHLAPDGTAAAHGIVSSRLRDMARFAVLYTPSWNKVANEQVVTPAMIERIRQGVRTPEFFMQGYDGPVFTDRLNDTILGNSRQWDAIFADGDFFKFGLMGQGIYVSPDRDLVIAYFSISDSAVPIHRYVRPIAKLFAPAEE